MSKYLEIKAQIEALTSQLEETRLAEFEAEVASIKERIAAFGIRPEQLFSASELSGKKASVRQKPKYSLNGHNWSGRGGMPNWYKAALAAGNKPEDMQVKPG